jgi:hypothetical protein
MKKVFSSQLFKLHIWKCLSFGNTMISQLFSKILLLWSMYGSLCQHFRISKKNTSMACLMKISLVSSSSARCTELLFLLFCWHVKMSEFYPICRCKYFSTCSDWGLYFCMSSGTSAASCAITNWCTCNFHSFVYMFGSKLRFHLYFIISWPWKWKFFMTIWYMSFTFSLNLSKLR